jgi:hypothetical protein
MKTESVCKELGSVVASGMRGLDACRYARWDHPTSILWRVLLQKFGWILQNLPGTHSNLARLNFV